MLDTERRERQEGHMGEKPRMVPKDERNGNDEK
jgi:hypothetical protein